LRTGKQNSQSNANKQNSQHKIRTSTIKNNKQKGARGKEVQRYKDKE